jgi:hypothetical protein
LLTVASPAMPLDGGSLAILRGRVECTDAQGKSVAPMFDCKDGSTFVLTTSGGKRYGFVSGDVETAVFTDGRVRQRDLQITAKLHEGDRLELVKVQSIRGGQLYDIYYFCELCNITAYAPGLCPCCRATLEFRETLATEKSSIE